MAVLAAAGVNSASDVRLVPVMRNDDASQAAISMEGT